MLGQVADREAGVPDLPLQGAPEFPIHMLHSPIRLYKLGGAHSSLHNHKVRRQNLIKLKGWEDC